RQVIDQAVDRLELGLPGAAVADQGCAAGELAFGADGVAHALDLFRDPIVGLDDVVQGVGDFAVDSGPSRRQANGKIAFLHRQENLENLFGVERFRFAVVDAVGRLDLFAAHSTPYVLDKATRKTCILNP